MLQTELRFREKALKKTEMQLDEFGKATASRETLMDQVGCGCTTVDFVRQPNNCAMARPDSLLSWSTEWTYESV